jgi:hypothetical protein
MAHVTVTGDDAAPVDRARALADGLTFAGEGEA